MKKLALAAVALGYLSTPSMADVESPSAYRLWLLCQMEDPQCGPLFVHTMMAAYVNPTVKGTKYTVPNPKDISTTAVAIVFMQQRPDYRFSAREWMINAMITVKGLR